MVASWLRAKPFSLSRIACARILVRQFGSVLWISLRRRRSLSVKGATNLVAVLIAGIVPENFCFATYFFNYPEDLAAITELMNKSMGCSLAPYKGDSQDMFSRFLGMELSLSSHNFENDRDLNFEE